MKDKQEQIKELGKTLWDILSRECIGKYCEDKNGNLVGVGSISVDGIAEELVKAGYGNIKQAQIDILNRLKVFSEPYPNSWGIYVIDVDHIDKFIEDIKNDKCNS